MQRLHVLDWQRRMDAYEFDGKPGQGKPKGVKSRKGSSTADFRTVYPWPYTITPMTINARASQSGAINCASAASSTAPTRARVESTKNPFIKGQKGKLFAGEKGVDVEVKWRAACTA